MEVYFELVKEKGNDFQTEFVWSVTLCQMVLVDKEQAADIARVLAKGYKDPGFKFAVVVYYAGTTVKIVKCYGASTQFFIEEE